MLRVVTCIVQDHDLWLVLVAAAICASGAWVTVQLYPRARTSGGGAFAAWIFLGAVAAGSTIWCTHFVAMLAYQPGMPVSYGPGLTAVSLAVAIIGSGLAFAAGCGRFRFAPVVGGTVYGVTVSAMHYTGMAAFAVDAIVVWDHAYVAASVACAMLFAAMAFELAIRCDETWHRYAATALVVVAIVSLHFTAMAAMIVEPLTPLSGAVTDESARAIVAISVAGVGLLVLGTGAVSYLLDNQARQQAAARLRYLTESAVDGMVVEQGGVILEVNAGFEHLVGESRNRLAGRSLSAFLTDTRAIEHGEFVTTDLRASTGKRIPVEVVARTEPDDPSAAGLVVYAVRDLRQRLAQEQRIAHMAMHDALTGLANRTAFLDRLETAMARLGEAESIAVLSLDLDRFKEINDLHGHAAGDHVLCVLAERMRDELDDDQILARLGGDEFVVMARIASRDEALALAERLVPAVSSEIAYEHSTLRCGASIGISLYPEDADDMTTLINNADLAMYRSKVSLDDSVCFYEQSMDEVVRMRRRMAKELREALDAAQFELHYQVQVDARSEAITGYEVLLRWKHPTRGYVSPAEFIPIAEETGLIVPIGEWVLRTACAEAAAWSVPHRIAVNLSGVQLGDIELPRLVHGILIGSGLEPSRLELEITETSFITDQERTAHILRQIKALGVSIAMDDFGTGYSSLATLRAFPFDKIKLDKSFIDEIEKDNHARAIMKAVLSLGDGLAIPVLAEGVETADQFALLRQEGCAQVQGFYFGRPSREIFVDEPAPLLQIA